QGKFTSIHWNEANRIHFLADQGTGSAIGTVQPDGKNLKYILQRNNQHITSFSISKNGTTYTANSPTHPSELFTLSISKKAEPVRKTFSNPWLGQLKLGKQEVI